MVVIGSKQWELVPDYKYLESDEPTQAISSNRAVQSDLYIHSFSGSYGLQLEQDKIALNLLCILALDSLIRVQLC